MTATIAPRLAPDRPESEKWPTVDQEPLTRPANKPRLGPSTRRRDGSLARIPTTTRLELVDK